MFFKQSMNKLYAVIYSLQWMGTGLSGQCGVTVVRHAMKESK